VRTLYIPSANTNRKELPLTSLPKTEADIEAGDDGGKTALHWAAWHGHGDVVALLLSRMDLGQIAAKDDKGNTALHLAKAGVDQERQWWESEQEWERRRKGCGDVAAQLEKWEREREQDPGGNANEEDQH
jgi:Ankyrin repeats (3 copies)